MVDSLVMVALSRLNLNKWVLSLGDVLILDLIFTDGILLYHSRSVSRLFKDFYRLLLFWGYIMSKM